MLGLRSLPGRVNSHTKTVRVVEGGGDHRFAAWKTCEDSRAQKVGSSANKGGKVCKVDSSCKTAVELSVEPSRRSSCAYGPLIPSQHIAVSRVLSGAEYSSVPSLLLTKWTFLLLILLCLPVFLTVLLS